MAGRFTDMPAGPAVDVVTFTPRVVRLGLDDAGKMRFAGRVDRSDGEWYEACHDHSHVKASAAMRCALMEARWALSWWKFQRTQPGVIVEGVVDPEGVVQDV